MKTVKEIQTTIEVLTDHTRFGYETDTEQMRAFQKSLQVVIDRMTLSLESSKLWHS